MFTLQFSHDDVLYGLLIFNTKIDKQFILSIELHARFVKIVEKESASFE